MTIRSPEDNAVYRNAQLTARDLEVLQMVHTWRGCTTAQLHTRFWAPCSPLSACYRRVARLVEAGFLSAHRLPSLSGVGSGKRFLTLGTAGRALLSEMMTVPLAELSPPKASTPLFVHHHEAVGDFRLAVEQATQDIAGVTLRSWTDESSLRQDPIRVVDTFYVREKQRAKTITLVPDAAFTLAMAGSRQSFWLEVDMGTVALTRVQLKIRGYFIQHRRSPTPVLFVTDTNQRADRVVRIILRQGEELQRDPTLFLVATRKHIDRRTVLSGPIWHRAGIDGLQSLLVENPEQLAGQGPPGTAR